jgi:hypothetical protein
MPPLTLLLLRHSAALHHLLAVLLDHFSLRHLLDLAASCSFADGAPVARRVLKERAFGASLP